MLPIQVQDFSSLKKEKTSPSAIFISRNQLHWPLTPTSILAVWKVNTHFIWDIKPSYSSPVGYLMIRVVLYGRKTNQEKWFFSEFDPHEEQLHSVKKGHFQNNSSIQQYTSLHSSNEQFQKNIKVSSFSCHVCKVNRQRDILIFMCSEHKATSVEYIWNTLCFVHRPEEALGFKRVCQRCMRVKTLAETKVNSWHSVTHLLMILKNNMKNLSISLTIFIPSIYEPVQIFFDIPNSVWG